MLIIALQVILMLIIVMLPLGIRSAKPKYIIPIDRDTSNAQYAINEHGQLEEIYSAKSQQKKSV